MAGETLPRHLLRSSDTMALSKKPWSKNIHPVCIFCAKRQVHELHHDHVVFMFSTLLDFLDVQRQPVVSWPELKLASC